MNDATFDKANKEILEMLNNNKNVFVALDGKGFTVRNEEELTNRSIEIYCSETISYSAESTSEENYASRKKYQQHHNRKMIKW